MALASIIALACAILYSWLQGCSCQPAPAEGALIKSVPVQLETPGSKEAVVRYVKVDMHADNIGSATQLFCTQHDVAVEQCLVLHEYVRDFLRKEKAHVLRNPHLLRHQSAADAELGRTMSPELFTDYSSIISSEDRVVELLKRKWSGHDMKRLSFLHSCQVSNGTNTQILERILQQTTKSGLLNMIDTLVVLNYGPAIAQAVKDRYSYKIEWIQVHPEIVYFEVPTLRIMHRLMAHLYTVQPNIDSQVLYLHTKGTSYADVYQQIQDWTDLMMYFLVEKHNTCLHLLQSGVVDAVGTLYRRTVSYRTPQDYFAGNFWWAAGSFLATRPLLQYEHSIKYDAEYWLLRYSQARIFVLHYSGVDHYTVPYPRLCYADPPSGRNDSLCGGPFDMRLPKYLELR